MREREQVRVRMRATKQKKKTEAVLAKGKVAATSKSHLLLRSISVLFLHKG